MDAIERIQSQLGTTAVAFRGFNVTNLGRTPELLDHVRYGAIVSECLADASSICRRATGRSVNLARRVRQHRKTTLKTYSEALALIVATELAHVRILRELFSLELREAKVFVGYSLGEITALICSGVYDFEAALGPLLELSDEVAELAEDTQLGILFSRGPAFDLEKIEQACWEISCEGSGTIDISSYLSPNTVLLMGQAETLSVFRSRLKDIAPKGSHLRINPHQWPPIHTRIMRQAQIADRASVAMDSVAGGFCRPSPPILSCITGGRDYNDYNSRELLRTWIDRPQRLWDVIDQMLSDGVETILHVGPEPNIIPATLSRLSNNVMTQMSGKSLTAYGLRAISRIVRRPRPWLTSLLSSDAPLLRAPFVEQIHVEDWLLDEAPA